MRLYEIVLIVHTEKVDADIFELGLGVLEGHEDNL